MRIRTGEGPAPPTKELVARFGNGNTVCRIRYWLLWTSRNLEAFEVSMELGGTGRENAVAERREFIMSHTHSHFVRKK